MYVRGLVRLFPKFRRPRVHEVLGDMSQVLMGFFFGTLGIILAPPLTAVFLVLVQKLYIEDALESRSEKAA